MATHEPYMEPLLNPPAPMNATREITIGELGQVLQVALQQERGMVSAALAEQRSRLPRRHLKDPETFSGKTSENVDRWLAQVNHYFRATGEEVDTYKVAFAVALLRGNAAAWWDSNVALARSNGHEEAECTWLQFQQGLIESFQAINKVWRARRKLATLTQKTSVAEYLTHFNAIAYDIPDMADGDKCEKFFNGLKPAVQQAIEVQYIPETFIEMVRKAEQVDASLYYAGKGGGKYGRNYGKPSYGGPTPMELGAIHETSNKPKFTKLTPDLREQLIHEGRCLYCRKPGHTLAECRSKPNKPYSPKGNRQ
jgi:Retrotransposon gag protein